TGTISPYYDVLLLVIDSYDANSLYVYFKNADTYVYLVGGTVATSTTPPNRMTLTQTTFQPWGSVAFPGCLYTLYDVNNVVSANRIYLVPSIWYASPCKTPAASLLALTYHVQWMESRTRPTIGYTVKKE